MRGKRQGKVIAWSSVGLGLAVLAVAAWASHDFVLELWNIHQLDSEEIREVQSAAEKLAELGSARAVPHLFDALKEAREREARSPLGARSLPTGTAVVSHSLEGALMRIVGQGGKAALPHLLRGLEDGDWYIRQLAVSLLGELGPGAEGAVSGLKNALTDKNDVVRWRAALALSKTDERVKIQRQEGRSEKPTAIR